MKRKIILLHLIVVMASTTLLAADNWKEQLRKELPLLGHRNWIVVADSAYPLQTSLGIETIYANEDQTEVVRDVIAELAKDKHVKPNIYTDAEMKFVTEASAAGITSYRKTLAGVLTNQPVQVLPHEQLIHELDDAGKTFKILIIKTPLTIPYTTVFFQLECGYWNNEAETRLRADMKAAGK